MCVDEYSESDIKKLFVIVKATTNCNLQCKYCSEPIRESESHSRIGTAVVDGIYRTLSALSPRKLDILLTGGEVFCVSTKRLDSIFSRFGRLRDEERKVSFHVQSNGTLITPEVCDLLEAHQVNIGISMDFPQADHDYARVFRDGSAGSWDSTRHAIELLRKRGINYSLLTVVSSQNARKLSEIYTGLKQFASPSSRTAKFILFTPSGRGRYAKSNFTIAPNALSKVLTEFFDIWAMDESDFRIQPFGAIVLGMLDGAVGACEFSNKICSSIFAVATDGWIYPCSRFDGFPEACFGNVQDDASSAQVRTLLSQKQERARFLNVSGCRNCEFFDLCNGGCGFDAFINTGDFRRKTSRCRTNKRLFSNIHRTMTGTSR